MGKVSADFHPLTYKELFADVLTDFPGLDLAILAAFIEYKSSGMASGRFGRDAPYVWPEAAFKHKLMHLHLKLPPGNFPEKLPQIDRVCKRGAPEQDAVLVYVGGWLEEDRYCLLAVLHPDGHAKAREEKLMRYLARLAQKFRDEN